MYEIILNTPRSNFDPKFKHGPHADGIIVSTSAKPVGSVTNQMDKFPINEPTSGQAMNSSHPTQKTDVLSVISLNQRGNQQPIQNKKKGKTNQKGGNRNENDNNDNKKNNAGGGQET